ncbi:hypothetical protein [Halorubrum ezzemoulense]|uniref:hypothetical protein n=1 Tax=Halorubrum ezzemoulense TaxID=337243 RepID=UPI002330B75F|nr:hypothetical protein [Halorubrum ezzemoulense]MDB2242408.1 hypothetical protein [Halorubrum ezzemoulense]
MDALAVLQFGVFETLPLTTLTATVIVIYLIFSLKFFRNYIKGQTEVDQPSFKITYKREGVEKEIRLTADEVEAIESISKKIKKSDKKDEDFDDRSEDG